MGQKHQSDLTLRKSLATGDVIMKPYNQTRSNSEKELNAIWTIFGVLSDGQWHRNMELKEKTRLNPSTLTNHLDQMKNLQIIERKEDVVSGKYAVFFRATPALITYIVDSFTAWEYAKELEPELNETKDPVKVLEYIHFNSKMQFVRLLKHIQQNKDITDEEINFLARCFLWADYKNLTSKLIEASHKIIDDLNITSIVRYQPEKTEGYERILKIQKKME